MVALHTRACVRVRVAHACMRADEPWWEHVEFDEDTGDSGDDGDGANPIGVCYAYHPPTHPAEQAHLSVWVFAEPAIGTCARLSSFSRGSFRRTFHFSLLITLYCAGSGAVSGAAVDRGGSDVITDQPAVLTADDWARIIAQEEAEKEREPGEAPAKAKAGAPGSEQAALVGDDEPLINLS